MKIRITRRNRTNANIREDIKIEQAKEQTGTDWNCKNINRTRNIWNGKLEMKDKKKMLDYGN